MLPYDIYRSLWRQDRYNYKVLLFYAESRHFWGIIFKNGDFIVFDRVKKGSNLKDLFQALKRLKANKLGVDYVRIYYRFGVGIEGGGG